MSSDEAVIDTDQTTIFSERPRLGFELPSFRGRLRSGRPHSFVDEEPVDE